MKARILIIEDVKEMGELIRLYLDKEGAETALCETAEQGLEIFRASSFDLIVLDINLPGIDGFEFLQRLRRESSVPVVIVSARDADEDMILGLGIGADEFVTKPFSPKVLTARVRAILRRVSDIKTSSSDVVRFGEFTLDLDGYLLKKGKEKIPLSTKEFEVLSFLATHPGKALNPETIYAEVWKNRYGDVTAVGVYIQRIRKKIETDPANPLFIETVHGMGYRFNAEAAPA
jgi:DNA-binding response OmpR family regulator